MASDERVSELEKRVADLDSRVRELETVQQLILRIMSATNPLNALLDQYGATETQEQAFYKLLDELVGRVRGPEQNRPSFAYFEMKLAAVFPEYRGDRQFTSLLIDTMKLDRPAYRELHAYATAQGWPTEGERTERT
jgi:hypothetical protein